MSTELLFEFGSVTFRCNILIVSFPTAADGAAEGAEAAEVEVVEVQASLRVASVWYTHSGPLLRELQSCVAEFQQYLANLARSIRAAAADMAIGLVHPRCVRDPSFLLSWRRCYRKY